MAVDRAALINELVNYGSVIFCDSQDDFYYLVVVSNWSSDEQTFLSIGQTYIGSAYGLFC